MQYVCECTACIVEWIEQEFLRLNNDYLTCEVFEVHLHSVIHRYILAVCWMGRLIRLFGLGSRVLIGWLANTLRKPPSRSACLGVGRFVFVLCWVTCYPRDEYNNNCLYIIIL